MTHLSAEELTSWYERGEGDRSQVIAHLATCEVCRKALSTIAATAEPSTSASPVISTAEALPHGYAALKPTALKDTARPRSWLRPLYGLAAAAVIVLGLFWVASPAKGPDDDAVRSSELAGLSPTAASDASVFTFASPFEASRYRLLIRDAGGEVVLSADGSDGRISVDRALRNRLTAGQSYSWVIAALDASGERIAESKPLTFRYQP